MILETKFKKNGEDDTAKAINSALDSIQKFFKKTGEESGIVVLQDNLSDLKYNCRACLTHSTKKGPEMGFKRDARDSAANIRKFFLNLRDRAPYRLKSDLYAFLSDNLAPVFGIFGRISNPEELSQLIDGFNTYMEENSLEIQRQKEVSGMMSEMNGSDTSETGESLRVSKAFLNANTDPETAINYLKTKGMDLLEDIVEKIADISRNDVLQWFEENKHLAYDYNSAVQSVGKYLAHCASAAKPLKECVTVYDDLIVPISAEVYTHVNRVKRANREIASLFRYPLDVMDALVKTTTDAEFDYIKLMLAQLAKGYIDQHKQ